MRRRPLNRWRTAATAEEEAELRMLRTRADETGREVSETAAALVRRLAEEASPRALARRKAAEAKAGAWHAVRRAAGERPGRLGLAAAGVTTGLVLVTVAVIWQHRRQH